MLILKLQKGSEILFLDSRLGAVGWCGSAAPRQKRKMKKMPRKKMGR
jgi:hypothetical protein